jgi:hypothetical protein
MTACASDFALDALALSGDAAPEVAAHVRECASCRERSEQRRLVEEEFERGVAPPFWRAVVHEHRRRRRRRLWALALAPALSAACALVILVARGDTGRPPVEVVAKGTPSLEIHCRRGGRTFAMAARDAVEPGDELRFVPRPASTQAHYIQVASIDGTGSYTPFYPALPAAESLPLPPSGQPLAGSIRLDDAPGPERLFVVLSTTPLPVAAVREAAQAHVSNLSAAGAIGGVAVESGWIVLPKTGQDSP